MNSNTDYNTVKRIMYDGVIGACEIEIANEWLGHRKKNMEGDVKQFCIPVECDAIPFSLNEIEKRKKDYLLILGVEKFTDGSSVTIRRMREIFGMNPNDSEPCFYNQDWYEKEEFLDVPMREGWFFVRREVYEDSRSVQPEELVKRYTFPSAIGCVYSFFLAWLTRNIRLWFHDFVWCSDTDHNGDRIYVGKYNDVDGINKNGFSIHRHLALRSCYGSID